MPIDIETIYRQRGLNDIPGVGEGIAQKDYGLEFINLGVDVARRGWLEEKNIVNTLPLDRLLKRLKNK